MDLSSMQVDNQMQSLTLTWGQLKVEDRHLIVLIAQSMFTNVHYLMCDQMQWESQSTLWTSEQLETYIIFRLH